MTSEWTGLIGFSSGYAAMQTCDTLLMLGTDFPYRQFYPDHAKIAQIDVRPENLGRRCRLDLGLVGDVGATISAVLPKLTAKADRSHLDKAVEHYRRCPEGTRRPRRRQGGRRPIHPQYLARVISEAAAADAISRLMLGPRRSGRPAT